MDKSDREFRAFIHDMLAFAGRIESIRRGFAKLIGLTGIQYTILISIRKLGLENEVSVKTVAEHLHLSGAFVTIETSKLARMGLVAKRRGHGDGRRVCLSVTRRGYELLNVLAPTQIRVNDLLFECLNAWQFQELRTMISELVSCGDRAISLLRYLAKEEASRRKIGGAAPAGSRTARS